MKRSLSRSTPTVSGRTVVETVLALGTLILVGCGGAEFPMGTASGTVTFQGQPVKEGMLWIYNKETATANQAQIADGQFELPGEVRTGSYTVYITQIPPAPGSPFDPARRIGTGDFPPGIPEKYQREDQSNLTIEIEEGHREVEIVVPES